MKKQLMASLLAFFLAALSCPAQEVPTKPQRWEVGVDALSLINKNHYPAYSIFVARKLGENGWAFRGRIGGNFNSRSNPYELLMHNLVRERDLFLLVGFQKSLVTNTKSDIYLGSDIAYMKSRITTEKFIHGPENDIFVDLYFDDSKITKNRLSLAPFIGYSKSLGPKITLRYEMALIIGKEIYEENGTGYLINDFDSIRQRIASDNLGTPSYTNFNKLRFDFLSLNPFSQLLLTYKF